MVNADGTIDFNYYDDPDEHGLTVTLVDGKYKFSYTCWGSLSDAYFVFNADGSIKLEDFGDEFTLTKSNGSTGETESGMFSATQQGVWTDAEMSHTLFIGANSIIYMDADGNEYEPTDLTQTLDGGSYRFSLADGTNVIFRFLEEDDGTIIGISMAVGGTPVELEPYTP